MVGELLSRRTFGGEVLARRYARSHSAADLEQLVRRYRPMARRLARRYGNGSALEDLEQVACVGLVKAIKRFDLQRGTSFTSFAVPTMIGELKRYLRETAWMFHVPRPVQERAQAVRGSTDAFAQRHGRAPTPSELAAEHECHERDIVEALVAMGTLSPLSLDRAPSDDEEGATLGERLASDDPGYEYVECASAIEVAMTSLTVLERSAVRMRFAEELSHQEIGTELDLPERQVARVLGQAIEHLARSAVAARLAPPGANAAAGRTAVRRMTDPSAGLTDRTCAMSCAYGHGGW